MSETKSISYKRRILKILLWLCLVLLVLLVILALLLRTSGFQTYVAGKAANYLSEQLGTQVRVGAVSITSLSDAELGQLYIQDFHGDTLFYAEALAFQNFKWNAEENHFHIELLNLQQLRIHLGKYEGEPQTDLAVLLEKLKTEGQKRDFMLTINQFQIREHLFSYDDENAPAVESGVDMKHLCIWQPVFNGDSLFVLGDSIHASVDSLIIKEQSGFGIKSFAGVVAISPELIALNDFNLDLNDSKLRGRVSMAQQSFADFKSFQELVYLRAELSESFLKFNDIAYFAPNVKLGDFGFDVSGRFRGTISDIKGRDVHIKAGKRTFLKGDIDMSGLPDFQNSFMYVDVDEFRTDRADIAALPIPFIQKNPSQSVPSFLARFGAVEFKGNFTGFVNAFTAYGDFSTSLGKLTTDITYKRDSATAYTVLDGKVATNDFALWKAIGEKDNGAIACELDLEAQGHNLKDFKAELNGAINKLEIRQYAFEALEVHGLLENRVFNGQLVSDDENLQFEFDGLADLRGKYPEVDFSAFVYHVDLKKLGLARLPEGSSISARITAEGLLAPDSLNGVVDMRDVIYCDGEYDHDIGDANLTSEKLNGVPHVELKSTIADVVMDGTAVFREIPLVAQQVLFSVFPTLDNQQKTDAKEQDFTALVSFKKTAPVLDLFYPDLFIAEGSQLQVDIDSRALHLDAQLRSTKLRYKSSELTNLVGTIDKTKDAILFSANAERSAVNDSVYISDIVVAGKAFQNDIELGIDWAGSSNGSNGEMDLLAQVQGPEKGTIRILPSEMFFGRGQWQIRDTATIDVDSSTLSFNHVEVWNENQLVKLNGVVSKNPEDLLNFELQDVDIANANLFLNGPAWGGVFRGKGTVQDVYGKTLLYTQASVDSLTIGPDLIGDIGFDGNWNERRKRIDLSGTVNRSDIRAVDFSGWFRPEDNNAISLRLSANKFDLGFLDSYIPSGLSEIEGRVTGNIYVDGFLSDPLINGEVQLDDAEIKVDFLNAKYRFSTPVDILPDMFAANQFMLYDESGHKGLANVTLIHTALKNFNYDVSVAMDSMMCLNTTAKNSDLFYGKAFATGTLNVSGFGKQLDIEVIARSEKGTHIIFPLGEGATISSFDFVEFVSNDSSALNRTAQVESLGISMKMDLEVTPDAFIELIFDPTVGDIMSGRGEGEIELSLQPSGELTMFGGINVTKGSYLFTLRNLINKRFSVDKGGRISWFGDPYNAKLDLKAVYKLRAPLYDVLFEANEGYKRRVPVEVVMGLSEKMLDPEIDFDVRLPSVDESTRTQVNSVLSTEQELNRQVFSLMVLNKFSAPASGVFASDAFAGTTGSELLSNQVSNWLSGLSEDLDLGVNYRPGDQVAQDELELAVSTQLFSERLLLNTNVGLQYGDRTGTQTNSFIGDFQLEYLLTDDGKLRLEAFSRSNDQNLNQVNQASTTQGVGLGYREDFDNWSQIWKGFKAIFKKKKKSSN